MPDEFDPAKYTPFLNLYKPDGGEAGWGTNLNINFDKLDQMLQHHNDLIDGVNVIKLGGNPISLGIGIVELGTQRMTMATDDPLLSQIRDNTAETSLNITNVAGVLSSPLGVKLLNTEDEVIGIDQNPLIVATSYDADGDPYPLPVILFGADQEPVDLGRGNVSSKTIRVINADDDTGVQKLISIEDILVRGSNIAFLPDGSYIYNHGVILRDTLGIAIGNTNNPISVSLAQDGNPINLAFGAGNYTDSTIRVVNATNDPNLTTIKNNIIELGKSQAPSDSAAPENTLMVGGLVELWGNGQIVSRTLAPLRMRNDTYGVLTYSTGGVINTILTSDGTTKTGTTTNPLVTSISNIPSVRLADLNGTYVGSSQNAVFIRNADNPADRGQSASKPLYVNITDGLDFDNMNLTKLGGNTIALNRGNITNGTMRVCVADDDNLLTQIEYNTENTSVKIDQIINYITLLLEDKHRQPFNSSFILYAQEMGMGYVEGISSAGVELSQSNIRLCPHQPITSGGEGWPLETFGPYIVNWSGQGKVIFSGSKDGKEPFNMDDAFRITVINSNGVTDKYEDTRPWCARPPVDITHLFTVGNNSVKLETWSTLNVQYSHTEGWLTFIAGTDNSYGVLTRRQLPHNIIPEDDITIDSIDVGNHTWGKVVSLTEEVSNLTYYYISDELTKEDILLNKTRFRGKVTIAGKTGGSGIISVKNITITIGYVGDKFIDSITHSKYSTIGSANVCTFGTSTLEEKSYVAVFATPISGQTMIPAGKKIYMKVNIACSSTVNGNFVALMHTPGTNKTMLEILY